MIQSALPPTIAPAPPGAAAPSFRGGFDQPLPCPLCDYDLRGLAQPRCPECGYRFDWSDLTDPAKQRHPYLFEHHPRRNVRSFVRTLLAGLRPRRFWATLRPVQASRPRRLLAYWLVASLLLPAGAIAMLLSTALVDVPEQLRLRNARASEYRFLATPEGRRLYPYALNPGATVETYVDAGYPPPMSLGYLRQVQRDRFGQALHDFAYAAAAYLLWPWLTFAVLLIFRASMRRAKVKPAHVLRCALYSCDAGLWVGSLAALLAPPMVALLQRELPLPETFLLSASVVFAAFTAWRLAAACGLYLRFDRPAAMAVGAQVVVLLLVMAVAVRLGRLGIL